MNPWESEPDQVEWASKSGRRCLILRGPFGALCGYVGVLSGHPLFQKDYSRCLEPWIHKEKTRKERRRAQRFEEKKARREDIMKPGSPSANFRKTMRGLKSRYPKAYRKFEKHSGCYRHTSPEGLLRAHGGITYSGHGFSVKLMTPRNRRVWWFGFDTAHYGDFVPKMASELSRSGEYRDLEYVRKEVESLAEQLDGMVKK